MATLEVRDRHGRFVRHVELRGADARLSLGRSEECDVIVEDSTVSRSHALLEKVGPGWSIQDVGSQNGTIVNGERVFAALMLQDHDEITVGLAKVIFLNGGSTSGPTTDVVAPPPRLTAGEYRVLCELVRPIRSGNIFVPPASRKEIADRLFVTEAAVQNMLLSMYRKFDIEEKSPDGRNRRTRLAEAAVQRGAIDPRDLGSDEPAP